MGFGMDYSRGGGGGGGGGYRGHPVPGSPPTAAQFLFRVPPPKIQNLRPIFVKSPLAHVPPVLPHSNPGPWHDFLVIFI